MEKAVNAVFKSSRLFCLFPYVVVNDSLVISTIRMTCLWFVTFVYAGSLVWFYHYPPSQFLNVPFVCLCVCPILCSAGCLALQSYMLTFFKHHLVSFLSDTLTVGRCLNRDLPEESSYRYLHSLLHTGNLVISWFPYSIECPEITCTEVVVYLLYVSGSFLNTVLLNQLVDAIRFLGRLFVAIPPTSDLACDSIKRAAGSLNSVFAPQLLLVLFSVSLSSLAKMFQILRGSQSVSHFHIVTVLVELWPVWRIVTACEQLTSLAAGFDAKLYRLLLNKNYWENINKRLLYHLYTRTKLVIRAGEIIEIDYTLIQSMIATYAAYIVVLVQFNDDNTVVDDSMNTLKPDF